MQWLKWEVTTQEEKTEPLLREDEPGELRRDGHGTSWGCFGSQHTAMSHQPYVLSRQTPLNAQGLVPPERGLEKPIPAQGRAQGRHRGMPREAPSAHSPGEDTAEAAPETTSSLLLGSSTPSVASPLPQGSRPGKTTPVHIHQTPNPVSRSRDGSCLRDRRHQRAAQSPDEY